MPQVILLTDVYAAGYGKYSGTYKIATEIRKTGYTCQVIDNYIFLGLGNLKILFKKFIKESTLLIGISCTLNKTGTDDEFDWGLKESELINLITFAKELNPNIKVVVGGSRINEALSRNFIDYSIINKADKSIVELLDHIFKNKPIKFTQLEHTKVINEVDYPYTQDEFKNSIIEYQHNDIILPSEALPLEIARGCIFSCGFCKYDLIGKKLGEWTKTEKTIKTEMIRNYELFGTTHYNISDELINESVDKLKMIHSITTSLPFKVEYTGYSRIDLIWRYPEMRELFLESGAKCLLFGIETLHEQAGKSIGKGLNPVKVKETLHYCREKWKNKILMTANFIIGLPHEDENHILSTLEYLLSDDGPLDIWTYTPLHFSINNILMNQNVKTRPRRVSKIELNPKKYGIIIDENSDTWTGTHMSADEIKSLLKKIESHHLYNSRILPFAKFKWFGRAISLGYSVDDIFLMLKNHTKFDESLINLKTNKLKQKYFVELLKINLQS